MMMSQLRSICNTLKVFTNLLRPLPQSSVPQRNVIYYTHSKGQLRSVKAVTQRYFRLNWGAWIRPRAGRHKHLWRKPFDLRWWTRQHVFCNKEQCEELDRTVSARYKIPTYFVDDIYEPYQERYNFPFVPLGMRSVSSSYIKTMREYKPNHDDIGQLFKEKPVNHPKQPIISPQKGGRKYFKKFKSYY